MTVQLFAILLTIFCIISGLLTEALKKAFKEDISYNVLALIDAIFVGGAGSAVAYVLMGITFNVNSILCIVLMMVAIWMGSMIGYDKIKQTVEQIIKTLN